MIGVLDCGCGNVRSVERMLDRIDADARILTSPIDLSRVHAVIIPGIGAFGGMMEKLRAGGWIRPLEQLVRRVEMPCLGICVGMQILAECSEEDDAEGLGWIPGEVRRIDPGPGLPVPHMKWAWVDPIAPPGLVDDGSRFYFAHSYSMHPDQRTTIESLTTYGRQAIVSSVRSENVAGVQFHPEKSHRHGMRLIERFVRGGMS